MPKFKYLYQNKKLFKDALEQEQNDFNYYCSPQYAKIIGQKYGLKGKVIERAFNQYFEAMKYFGLTQMIDRDKLRRHIGNMDINYVYDFGEGGKLIGALTDIELEEIQLRKSAKNGNYGNIFHEFNHLISSNYLKVDDFLAISGYCICSKTQNLFNYFDEGVTEFLTCLQLSYLNKKPIVLSDCYFKETAYAHSLYLICGNALFEGYFNNDFQYIARAIPNTTAKDIEFLADIIEEFSYIENPVNVVELDCLIHTYLMEMFSDKVYNDVLNNLDKFNSFFEIQKILTKGYCNYANSLVFDKFEKSVLNLNRIPIFENMTNNYFDILDAIADHIKKNPKSAKFKCNYEGSYENSVEQFNYLLQTVNDHNYGFIEYTAKPINVIDYLNDPLITIENKGKAEYLRKKEKFDKIEFMKNYELYEKYLEIFTNNTKNQKVYDSDLEDVDNIYTETNKLNRDYYK